MKAEFARKYWNLPSVPEMKSHTWLCLRPERIVSWDFSKIPAGKDRRLQAGKSSSADGSPLEHPG